MKRWSHFFLGLSSLSLLLTFDILTALPHAAAHGLALHQLFFQGNRPLAAVPLPDSSGSRAAAGFSQVPQFANASIPSLRVDRLPTVDWWQQTVARQVAASQNQQYQACLFGDSISSKLGNSLGDQIFNFAIGGMSTISLIEQLKQLVANHVQCQTVLIEIGTNDAMYTISNDQFVQNLKESIDLARSLQPDRILLLPAFYSTVEASTHPDLAGPISRVDEINQLIQEVATEEDLPVETASIQSLFDGEALRGDLTVDGVHLNDAGLDIYRQALLNLFNSPTTSTN